jgi:single-stranded-DNA-specific exonuclease
VIVTAGLAAMPRTERPGLRALLEETRLWGREVDENDVSDSIGPAFGRVSDGKGGNTALALLLSLDIEAARETARGLVDGRAAWRSMAQAAWNQVREGRAKGKAASGPPVEIVESSVRIEVLGYVTSRLSDELGKPVIVLSDLNGDRMAEARGPGGFNLVHAFNSMSELFLSYGGHPRAAGFTIRNENVPAFRERMNEYAAEHPPEPRPRTIDAELPLVGATSEVGREFDSLAPFGQGNPRPVLVARGTGMEQYEAALALGLRFSTPVRLGRTPVDLVYRLRYEGERAFASVLDAIGTGESGRAGGTATDGRG